jgi:hypothetical protein
MVATLRFGQPGLVAQGVKSHLQFPRSNMKRVEFVLLLFFGNIPELKSEKKHVKSPVIIDISDERGILLSQGWER